MVMNANLSFADWHKMRNLDGGMYGFFKADPNNPEYDPKEPNKILPENPVETKVVPRIVTLNPGQPIFRWIDSKSSGRSLEQKACGPWWSSKRGAQQILARARGEGSTDTKDAARWYSSVARKWPSDLKEVVHVMVTQPIKAFMGVGRDIYDEKNKEVWDSHGLQIYIPQMSEQKNGTWTLSRIAKSHLRVVWAKSSDEFDEWALDKAMEKGQRMKT